MAPPSPSIHTRPDQNIEYTWAIPPLQPSVVSNSCSHARLSADVGAVSFYDTTLYSITTPTLLSYSFSGSKSQSAKFEDRRRAKDALLDSRQFPVGLTVQLDHQITTFVRISQRKVGSENEDGEPARFPHSLQKHSFWDDWLIESGVEVTRQGKVRTNRHSRSDMDTEYRDYPIRMEPIPSRRYGFELDTEPGDEQEMNRQGPQDSAIEKALSSSSGNKSKAKDALRPQQTIPGGLMVHFDHQFTTFVGIPQAKETYGRKDKEYLAWKRFGRKYHVHEATLRILAKLKCRIDVDCTAGQHTQDRLEVINHLPPTIPSETDRRTRNLLGQRLDETMVYLSDNGIHTTSTPSSPSTARQCSLSTRYKPPLQSDAPLPLPPLSRLNEPVHSSTLFAVNVIASPNILPKE
ncbi:1536_t:CDS:2 [Acaulospora colombiana]|uniref:1536_t:CDS:1 n=1 Tax=Acaulospora colombiana TaxID=27376 RepID=A0ACA9L4E9_9GLOM|nr:1536_t:CDS:2 [Acaulospora colombiana]